MISFVNIVQIVIYILRLYVDLCRLMCVSLPVPVLLSIYLPLAVEKPVGNNINLVFSGISILTILVKLLSEVATHGCS